MQFASNFIAILIDIAKIHISPPYIGVYFASMFCLDPSELLFPALFAIFSFAELIRIYLTDFILIQMLKRTWPEYQFP